MVGCTPGILASFTLWVSLVLGLTARAWWREQDRCDIPPTTATSEARTTELRAGIPYLVLCRDGIAEFTLPAIEEGRYTVIIGSLGDPLQSHPVTIRSMPAHRIRLAQHEWGDFRTLRSLPRHRPFTPDSDRNPIHKETVTPLANGHSAINAPDSRTFFLHRPGNTPYGPLEMVPVQTTVMARGPHIRVLHDTRLPITPQAIRLAETVVRLFEGEIRPRAQQLVGLHHDVDGDGMLSVVLTPLLTQLSDGRQRVDGLVQSADCRRDLPRPKSNNCDVLFLNSELAPGSHLKAVLAHEYMHVIGFSRRFTAHPDASAEEDWLNEGIAHVAEPLHHAGMSNLRNRIDVFRRASQASPLVIADYHAAGLWRDPGCRGATFLFLQWCVDRFGPHVLRSLIDGPETGVANIESATGATFETLFRRWTVDHTVSGRISPVSMKETASRPIVLRGTAATAVEFPNNSEDGKPHHIRIRGEGNARLQVTVIRRSEKTDRTTSQTTSLPF